MTTKMAAIVLGGVVAGALWFVFLAGQRELSRHRRPERRSGPALPSDGAASRRVGGVARRAHRRHR